MENSVLQELREHERVEEFKQAILVCSSKMSLPLFLLFWLADIVYAPEYKWLFLGLRFLMVPFNLLVNDKCTKNSYKIGTLKNIGVLCAFANSITITIMILLTSKAASPYYAGLNLVSLGILAFFPWSNAYAIGTMLVIFLPYYIGVTLSGLDKLESTSLYLNTFFIVGTIIASLVIRWFRENLKLNEIRAKLDLSTKNTELGVALEQLKVAQLKIIQSSQMADLGNLSASVAHEIRSPIRGISWAIGSLSDVVKENKFGPEEVAFITEDLEKIKSGIDYISSVITNIRNAAGNPDVPCQIESLKEIVQIAIGVTSYTSNGKATLTVEIDPGVKARLQKVKAIRCVTNLITNSVDALYAGKTKSPVIKISASNDGDKVLLVVADNGPGIPVQIQEKIFQPFNSSKAVGEGTGLGLSMIKNMMEEMAGTVEFVTSGTGTIFTLKFPLN